jgi:TRAP-type mannitol/chloroaromatic compound transport system permease small subunit
MMNNLLALARGMDWISDRFGVVAKWAVLASCLISAGNAVIRYFFNISSNGWLEIQWYLFAACVMLGAAQVLRVNEHVRVDLLYGRLTSRGQVWVDLCGLVCFLLPVIGVLAWMTWDLFLGKFVSGEMSNNAGGLVRWPAVLMLPVGFALVWLQALAEIVKRVAWLRGEFEMDTHYERPLQ